MENDTYQNKRTKIGQFMYSITNKIASKLCKHKWLYYVLNCSRGILTTLIGFLITLFLLPFKKPNKYYGIWYFEIFKSWGGASIGIMFLRDTTSSSDLNKHEFGHTWQNAIYGPFFIFLIGIPSLVRYWYQRIREKKGKTNKAYDLIWFEGSATTIGKYIVDKEDLKNDKIS